MNQETLLLVLLLTAVNQPAWKESLSSALEFYRENRDLIALFAKTAGGAPPAPEPSAPEAQPSDSPASPYAAEKSRPDHPDQTGNQKILEEFLKLYQPDQSS